MTDSRKQTLLFYRERIKETYTPCKESVSPP